jgi:tetratricopeptide (TPR) repeat protein/KaiC/GvpD/RAD55 family RecA-like ATPase
MRRETLFTEIKLLNLNQAYVSEIAENMMGGKISPELAEKLSTESRGNALFVVESLRMLFERGSLYCENDQWRLTVDTLGIPDKLKDVILRRLSQLKFNQRRVLDVASVIGEKFDVDLLSTVLNQDSLEVLENLNTIARSTSLICVEQNSFRFDHAKSRDAIYEEIALPLKRGYHKRAAEKLETTVKNGSLPLGEIAYHYAEAGIEERAIKFAMDAGQDALARFSNAEAIKYFTYVLGTSVQEIGYSDCKIRAQEGLGDALLRSGHLGEAIMAFERLGDAARNGLIRLRAIRKSMWACILRGDYRQSIELSRVAEQYSTSDRLEYARVLSIKGRAYDYMGNAEEAIRNKEQALKVFQEQYALQDVANGLVELATSYSDKEMFENALVASLCSVAMYKEFQDLSSQEYAFGRLAWRLHILGFLKEAIEIYLEAIRICERIGSMRDAAWLHDFLGHVYEDIGEKAIWSVISNRSRNGSRALEEIDLSSELSIDSLLEYRTNVEAAVAQSLKGVEFAEKTDSTFFKFRSYCSLTRQFAKLGDLGKTEEFYRKLMSTFDTTNRTTNNAFIAYGLASRADYFVSKQQWKEANELFEEALYLLKDVGAQKEAARYAETRIRFEFGLALLKQNCLEEAMHQIRESRKISEEVLFEEKFSHVNLGVFFMVPKEVEVGEEFSIQFYIVNAAKNPAKLVRISDLFLSGLKVTDHDLATNIHGGFLEFKGKTIAPFQVEKIKLKLEATSPGSFNLSPALVYIDELGQTRTYAPVPIIILAKSPQPRYEVFAGRIPTGTAELDELLFGGVPQHQAVVLTSPSTDERESIVKKFLETGAAKGEVVFHVTAEATTTKELVEKKPNLYLFICNPRADEMLQNASNVFKLKGLESLTEIDIALTKAFRTLSSSAARRICLELVSDVLLQHHAVSTRRWLSALLPTLKSKGFTILAVMDPQMHPTEELQAVLGVFDGEIRITEKETPEGIKQALKIRKLRNQKYSENEAIINKNRLAI